MEKKWLSCRDLIERYGFTRRGFDVMIKAGTFPKGVRLGSKALRWDIDELIEWENKRRGEK
jgi:predicted DNA-binding transcriptional regulator AlpA